MPRTDSVQPSGGGVGPLCVLGEGLLASHHVRTYLLSCEPNIGLDGVPEAYEQREQRYRRLRTIKSSWAWCTWPPPKFRLLARMMLTVVSGVDEFRIEAQRTRAHLGTSNVAQELGQAVRHQ